MSHQPAIDKARAEQAAMDNFSPGFVGPIRKARVSYTLILSQGENSVFCHTVAEALDRVIPLILSGELSNDVAGTFNLGPVGPSVGDVIVEWNA